VKNIIYSFQAENSVDYVRKPCDYDATLTGICLILIKLDETLLKET